MEFFDGLASEYHLLFEDWWEAAEAHGRIIGQLLLDAGVAPGDRLLDCTCGIGTQALPLALRGYLVLGSDISAAAIARARREAEERGIALDFLVCDVREVGRRVSPRFQAVIACDNPFAHLATSDDLVAALRSVRMCLDTGGLFLTSIRDYDRLRMERPDGVMPVTYVSGGRRRIVGQAWEWAKTRRSILIRLFILRESHEGWSCAVWSTRSRAWLRSEMTAALLSAGYGGVTWHMPEDSGYYQPIVTAIAV